MLHIIISHGLPLLLLVVGLESFGIPLPGETALVGFGVLAAQGHYNIAVVIAIAALGAIVGDNVGYWLIGRRGGQALLRRWPWLNQRFQRVRAPLGRAIQRHGGAVLFFGRFIALLRFTAAWAAGIAGMPWWRFLLWNALGGIAWATLVGLVAYYGGRAAGEAISRYGLYAGVALAAVGTALWWGIHVLSKRFRKRILR